ncbi:MAG TPA: alpha/beta hydrolase [Burkholderiales bacterium]|jgi:triacylglycerol lipase
MRISFAAALVLAAAGQAMAQMPADVAAKLKEIGPVLNPPMIQATFGLYIPRVVKASAGVSSSEDLAYGPDERQRLDVFAPAARAGRLPVVLFVPGGGYVGGAKSRPGVPFYQNVGVFFAKNGVIGVTMNYRLAPKAVWPAGGEDVAAALAWVRKNIGEFGGDPDRIFVYGQSAGGTHAAHYIFDERLQPAGGNDGVAGAILQSPILDPADAPPGPNVEAYFGKDRAAWADRNLLSKLDGRKIPVFLVYAELDPREFRDEAAKLREGLCKRDGGACPRTSDLKGHNHISEIAHLGSADDVAFGLELLEFVRTGR